MKANGSRQKGDAFYDKRYIREFSKGKRAIEEWSWYPIWARACEWLIDIGAASLLDVGCGPGRGASVLASKMAELNRSIRYEGWDFSGYAIDRAKELCLDGEFVFRQCDVFEQQSDRWDGFDAYWFTEVLEHVDNDQKLLEMVPEGRAVFLSVPRFLCTGHVRKFDGIEDVAQRYLGRIAFRHIEQITKNHLVACGVRKGL